MTRSGRVLLPVMLGLALPTSAVCLVYSVAQLVRSTTTYHVNVVAPINQGLHPPSALVARLQAEQTHWGDMAMFAVAAFALCLLLTLVSWLLGAQQDRLRRAM